MSDYDNLEERWSSEASEDAKAEREPEPWTLFKSGRMVAKDGREICLLTSAIAADACLIAAAPQMYELLTTIHDEGWLMGHALGDALHAILKQIGGERLDCERCLLPHSICSSPACQMCAGHNAPPK